MLEVGIYVEPKWNGFRFVVEKAGDRILTFTEDAKRDLSPLLKETVEVGGKLYTPCGRTFNSKVQAKAGDVIRVEATEITVDRSGPKRSVTWFTPVVIDTTDEPPMTPDEVAEMTLPGEVKKLIQQALEKRIPLVKTKEERYVLGIVIEPETVDAQKDIYSAVEIHQAAHGFMENFARIGLMHRAFVGDDVKILESYLAPVTFELDGIRIKKGTWLLAVRIASYDLWQKVKSGEITGFSIGG